MAEVKKKKSHKTPNALGSVLTAKRRKETQVKGRVRQWKHREEEQSSPTELWLAAVCHASISCARVLPSEGGTPWQSSAPLLLLGVLSSSLLRVSVLALSAAAPEQNRSVVLVSAPHKENVLLGENTHTDGGVGRWEEGADFVLMERHKGPSPALLGMGRCWGRGGLSLWGFMVGAAMQSGWIRVGWVDQIGVGGNERGPLEVGLCAARPVLGLCRSTAPLPIPGGHSPAWHGAGSPSVCLHKAAFPVCRAAQTLPPPPPPLLLLLLPPLLLTPPLHHASFCPPLHFPSLLSPHSLPLIPLLGSPIAPHSPPPPPFAPALLFPHSHHVSPILPTASGSESPSLVCVPPVPPMCPQRGAPILCHLSDPQCHLHDCSPYCCAQIPLPPMQALPHVTENPHPTPTVRTYSPWKRDSCEPSVLGGAHGGHPQRSELPFAPHTSVIPRGEMVAFGSSPPYLGIADPEPFVPVLPRGAFML